MMLTPKRAPSTSLTVSETPSIATEPLGATNRFKFGRHFEGQAERIVLGTDAATSRHAVDMTRDDMAAQFVADCAWRARD